MRSFVQLHDPLRLRLFLACDGAAFMIMGARGIGAGLISYDNVRGQPVPSPFACWLGAVLAVAALVPNAVYRWFVGWLPEELRPRHPITGQDSRYRPWILAKETSTTKL